MRLKPIATFLIAAIILSAICLVAYRSQSKPPGTLRLEKLPESGNLEKFVGQKQHAVFQRQILSIQLPHDVALNGEISLTVDKHDNKIKNLQLSIGPMSKQELGELANKLIDKWTIQLGSRDGASYERLERWQNEKSTMSDWQPVFLGKGSMPENGNVELVLRPALQSASQWTLEVEFVWP